MNLYFDLDGTLIDTSQRHYQVYDAIARILGFKPLTFDRYRKTKRTGCSTLQILADSAAERHVEDFQSLWIAKIEQDDVLALDTPFNGAIRKLDTLKRQCTLTLVSLRQSESALMRQLERLRFSTFFHRVLSGRPTGEHAHFKALLISQYCSSQGGWIIGDTEADVLAGKRLNLASCAVASGLRSRAFLERLHPDHIIDCIGNLPDHFEIDTSSLINRL